LARKHKYPGPIAQTMTIEPGLGVVRAGSIQIDHCFEKFIYRTPRQKKLAEPAKIEHFSRLIGLARILFMGS
jgi:hypothetical protein